MPYQTTVPNSAQSPSLFPSQGQENFARLKTILGANHKFNDSTATDDGYHQNIQMLPISTPANDGTIGQAFVNSSDATNQLWFKDGLNRVFQVTPTIPIYAACSFFWTGAVISYRSQFNVSSVTRISAGIYQINFTTALPSVNYIVSGNWMRDTSPGGPVILRPQALYTSSVSTTFTQISTIDTTGSARDGLGVTVVMMGG